jgi:hypothetical protein
VEGEGECGDTLPKRQRGKDVVNRHYSHVYSVDDTSSTVLLNSL